jgi:hypothetical protein
VPWNAQGMVLQDCVLALTGKTSDAIQTLTSAITAWRSTGATLWTPMYFSYLAGAYAELDQLVHGRF